MTTSAPGPRARRSPRPSGAASAAALLGLAVLLAGCGEKEAAERPAGVLVDTTLVATRDVPRVLRPVGTVEAMNQTTLAAEIEGQVSRIVADEGASVDRGQAVLQIDPTPFQLQVGEAAAALERVQAALDNDRRLLERYEQLLAAGALDQQTYDDVAARVKSEAAEVASARSRLNQARWSLGKTTIRAPFHGVVADRLVELGTFVGVGDPLFEIVDATPVRVAFELPEPQVGTIELGDSVSFRVRTDPAVLHRGVVVYVSPDLDPRTRTQTAKAEYPNEAGDVTPGSFADLEAVSEVRPDAPVIPEVALVTEGEQNFVYVIRDGSAEKREVELGERLEGGLEVTAGLEGGEIIVTEGHRELFDGAPVRIAQRPAEPAGEVGPGRE
jgi:membrane fusion protein (multidrug efflux system)